MVYSLIPLAIPLLTFRNRRECWAFLAEADDRN